MSRFSGIPSRQNRVDVSVEPTLLTHFVEQMPVAVAMLDQELQYVATSRMWRTFFHVGSDMPPGKDLGDELPGLPERWREFLGRGLAGKTMEGENVLSRTDGKPEFIRWEMHPWRHNDGAIGGVLVYSEIVTARKLQERDLRQSLAQLRAILDAAGDGVLAMYADGTIINLNRRVAEMFGYPVRELLYANVSILLTPPYRERFQDHVRQGLHRAPERMFSTKPQEIAGLHSNGTTLPLEISINTIWIEEIRLFTVVLRDITERKRAQESLLQALNELERKQAILDADLQAAADMQRNLLPQSASCPDQVQAAWIFEPCVTIGGDIFNLLRLDAHHLGAFMIDVSGHGVPSALMSFSIVQLLQTNSTFLTDLDERTGTRRFREPDAVLTLLDREFPITRFGKYFTMLYMILDLRTGVLRYASAGHPPPVCCPPFGTPRFLSQRGPIIGLDGYLPFETQAITLDPKEMVLLYTDGVTENHNASGEPFGVDRLLALVEHHAGGTARELTDAVHTALQEFMGEIPPRDDVTLLTLQFQEPSVTQTRT